MTHNIAMSYHASDEEKSVFNNILNDIDFVLKNSVILLISIPLNKETQGLIGKRELELMKTVSKLINFIKRIKHLKYNILIFFSHKYFSFILSLNFLFKKLY
ncbi:MAG TPA: NAD(P)-dependent oxidoreductase [Bacteroidales bacterium]|jgi:hypothetical protein|nr:NAD(P)-dependent oxidoreductase [Bacteroidales bacterium]HPU47238.1 NAD(P)-dependent oxidoreductase [Bacteroidales bacterium]HPZ36952.1 NAD(P)-dependent oxidoreductase [Bacteroidales bacterium]HQD34997.1 NAD(P)-dependent oxidoreductase [Bacteroidales bacterium]HXK91651.1 NAD(P)-dependent oxidoreductase [Bacteroidales bacterium]